VTILLAKITNIGEDTYKQIRKNYWIICCTFLLVFFGVWCVLETRGLKIQASKQLAEMRKQFQLANVNLCQSKGLVRGGQEGLHWYTIRTGGFAVSGAVLAFIRSR